MVGRLGKWLLFVAIVGGMVLTGYRLAKRYFPQQGVRDTRRTTTVARGDIVQRVSVSGKAMPLKTTSVSAPFDGYVKGIFVKVGDAVKKGDPLISFADNLSLPSQDIFPLRAPFAGTVVQVFAAEGQNVTKGGGQQGGGNADSLIRIDDLSAMLVWADVPEVEYSGIKLGLDAEIKAPALPTKTYHGTVTEKALAPTGQDRWDRNNVVFPMKLKIKDPDSDLKSGMSVIIDIIADRRDGVLVLPHEFVASDQGKHFVTKAKGVGRVEVTIGIQDDQSVEIKTGVEEGDVVEQIDFLAITKG